LDLAMPDTDGFELIRRLRLHPNGARLPAAALSAFHGKARTMALSAGFQRYETKPVAPTEFVGLIASLAAERQRS